MRTLVRIVSALALAALVALVPAAGASAAKKPKPAAWAKKHDLRGAWRAKDADRDGVKNVQEFKLGTNPRKADSDKDGLKDGDEVKSANDPLDPDTDGDDVKDGAEHAGVVTAFDGDTITIRQFKGGNLTASVPAGCDDVGADDSSADDEDDGFVPVEEGDWTDEDFGADDASVDDDEPELELGDEGEDASCDLADVEKGDVLTSAELKIVGGVKYVTAVEIA
jgi:hypothetical protein